MRQNANEVRNLYPPEALIGSLLGATIGGLSISLERHVSELGGQR